MESSEVLAVQTPKKIMFKKFEKTIPSPQFLDWSEVPHFGPKILRLYK